MIVGTRGSELAVVQTERVCERLRAAGFEDELKVRKVQSLGDALTGRSLSEMPEKGVFVKRLDRLVLDGEIDFAVHSMKDIPLERDERLETAAVLPRDSPYDALVLRHGHGCGLDELLEAEGKGEREGAVVGTSSVRRKFQLLNYAAERGVEVRVKEIRGNVGTRLRKLKNGEYDGVILAEAGLERLGLGKELEHECERLNCDPFVPSPNQGIIAVVTRRGTEASERLKAVDDAETRREAEVEQEVLKVIGGGCSLPVGVHACCGREGGKESGSGRGNKEGVELAVYFGFGREKYVLRRAVLSRDRSLQEAREFAKLFLAATDTGDSRR